MAVVVVTSGLIHPVFFLSFVRNFPTSSLPKRNKKEETRLKGNSWVGLTAGFFTVHPCPWAKPITGGQAGTLPKIKKESITRMGVADWRHLSSFRHFCPFKADFCIDPSPNDNNAAGPATKARVCVWISVFPLWLFCRKRTVRVPNDLRVERKNFRFLVFLRAKVEHHRRLTVG